MVISLVMVGGLLYNLTSISIAYFSHPVDVTITLLHQTELVFPAVTICNMSPVRASSLAKMAENKRRRRQAKEVANRYGRENVLEEGETQSEHRAPRVKRSQGSYDSFYLLFPSFN